MAETISKRRETEENDGEDTEADRISSLPDSVLLHLLSFLPTKTCVRTISLVSRRYRHLWEHLQVLDFYDDYRKLADGQSELFRHFALFVNAVLARRRSRDIRKMRLSCAHSPVDEFSAYSVDTWIRTAIGPHLEELHLAIFSIEDYGSHLPLTIFTTCTNLVSLSLYGDISLQLLHSSGILLPSLKTLQIDIGYVDVTYVDVILSGCPILETLELSFSPESLTTLSVPHSLKRLKSTVENDVGTYLQIDAPGLNYLSLTNITFGDDAVRNLHNVVEAHLDVFPPPGENVSVEPLLNLLRALSGVKHLVLRCSTTKWLFGGPTIVYHYPELDFPEFRHLLHLELILRCFNMNFLFHVLQKCPMLQALIIQNDKDLSPHPYGFAAQPESVPNCLVSHLTFIHFKGYQGYLTDQEFARYVLQKGLVLKTMHIPGLSLDLKEKWEKYRILKRFSDTPRGSAICQLKFDWAVSPHVCFGNAMIFEVGRIVFAQMLSASLKR